MGGSAQSNTVTPRPDLASAKAAAKPAGPPPTMQMSLIISNLRDVLKERMEAKKMREWSEWLLIALPKQG
jgi:hypothetical protein